MNELFCPFCELSLCSLQNIDGKKCPKINHDYLCQDPNIIKSIHFCCLSNKF